MFGRKEEGKNEVRFLSRLLNRMLEVIKQKANNMLLVLAEVSAPRLLNSATRKVKMEDKNSIRPPPVGAMSGR